MYLQLSDMKFWRNSYIPYLITPTFSQKMFVLDSVILLSDIITKLEVLGVTEKFMSKTYINFLKQRSVDLSVQKLLT
jgi:hypothetical protein